MKRFFMAVFVAIFHLAAVADMTIATKPYVDSGIAWAKNYCDAFQNRSDGFATAAQGAKADTALQSVLLRTINGASVRGSGDIKVLAPYSAHSGGDSNVYMKIGYFPLTSNVENVVSFQYTSGNHNRSFGMAVMAMNSNTVIYAENYIFRGSIHFGYAPNPDRSGHQMIVAYISGDAWLFDILPYTTSLQIEVKKYMEKPSGWTEFIEKKFAWQ
jgi:hypothetical protein